MRRFLVLSMVFGFWSCFVSQNSMAAEVEQGALRSACLGSGAWQSNYDIPKQLQAHFAEVLTRLQNQTNQSLDLAVQRFEDRYGVLAGEHRRQIRKVLQTRRAAQLKNLQEYADRGVFPRNEGHSKTAVPIFVDDHGTHCAVGYLMHRSGADDVVQLVVLANNLVLVDEVGNGPALDWILNSGLTKEEAALIQPSYTPPPFDATLADFETPGFSVSEHGMTISDLVVTQLSYNSTAPNFEQVCEEGIFFIDLNGVDYPIPEEFGIAVGQGVHVEKKKLFYEPVFNNWIYLGRAFQSLNEVEPGDNAIAYKITYVLSGNDEKVSQMALSSSTLFNANFLFGQNDEMKAMTTTDGVTAGQGSIGATGFDFLLNGSTVFLVGSNQFLVTTYIIDYQPDGVTGGGFSSFWHEFDLVLPGDVNNDGAINLLDVGPFVDAISNDFLESAADINCDGSDDLLDVAGFVELLGS